MEIRAYTEYDEAEILGLYASVGWTAYTDDPAALRNGFANSLLTLAAYEKAVLAGLIRVVGDGHTVIFCTGYSGAASIPAARHWLGAAGAAQEARDRVSGDG